MKRTTTGHQDSSGEREKPAEPEDDIHVYSHSGIRERQGAIPMWLLLVVIGLLIWSVYYTIRYWTPG